MSQFVEQPLALLGFIGERDGTAGNARLQRILEMRADYLMTRMRDQSNPEDHPHAAWLLGSKFKGAGDIFGLSYAANTLSEEEYKEALMAKLLVPLTPGDQLECRVCDASERLLMPTYHCLSCRAMSAQKIRRHDEIVRALDKYIKRVHPGAVSSTNPTFGDAQGLACDLQVTANGTTWYIDVGITSGVTKECLPSISLQPTTNPNLESTLFDPDLPARRYQAKKTYKYRTVAEHLRIKITPLIWLDTGRPGPNVIEFRKIIENLNEEEGERYGDAWVEFSREVVRHTSKFIAQARKVGRLNLRRRPTDGRIEN